MADSKITALTAISTVDPTADPLVIVDVSDTSMAASGTTKKSTINQLLGSGGTATLASATITGAATVGTTLGVTGVSTLASASVTGALTVGTSTALATGSGRGNVTVNGSTDAILAFGIGGVNSGFVLEDAGGMTLLSTGATYIRAYTNGVERTRIDSSGNVNITTGNVVMATSGKGIDFAATSGTGTSELLADYEEGTWTPTFTASSGTLTTVTLVSANYTKIGRRVSIDIDFFFSNIGTASGVLFLTLPFTRSGTDTCGAFREIAITGSMGSIYGDASDLTKVCLSFYNNTSIIVNTYRFNGTYTYNV